MTEKEKIAAKQRWQNPVYIGKVINTLENKKDAILGVSQKVLAPAGNKKGSDISDGAENMGSETEAEFYTKGSRGVQAAQIIYIKNILKDIGVILTALEARISSLEENK